MGWLKDNGLLLASLGLGALGMVVKDKQDDKKMDRSVEKYFKRKEEEERRQAEESEE
jgi:hypothetical protein